MAEDRQVGIVKWFDAEKGYGFIEREGGPDIFVHANAIRGKAHEALRENDRVEFKVVRGNRGLRAEDVVVLGAR